MRLKEVASITMGQSPNSLYYNSEGVGYPFLQGCAQFGKTYPGTSIFCSMPMRIAPAGSILFSVRAPVGEINKADQDYCIGRGLAAVEAKSIDSSLLYYLLLYERRQLTRIAQGSTFEAISSADLAECIIPDLGDLQNQTAIADILTTVDRAIEQTEALIAKQRRIKAGLLHDLLTRGIDEHGRLRDPSTHRFKPSPVGLVPEEWEYDQFGSLVEQNVFGPRFSAALYSESGNAAMLRTTDLDDEGNIISAELPRANLDTVRFSAHFLQYGDLVVSRSGTVGVTTVFVSYEVPVVPAAFMIRFRLSKDANPDYFRLFFNAPNGRRLIHSNMAGGVQSNVTGTAMMHMSLPIPPRTEQDRIYAAMKSADLALRSTELEAAKLESIKIGLMQDLLSGWVSVTGLIK